MLKLLQFGNFRLGCCCLRPFRNRTPTFVPVFNSWSFVSFRYHLPPLIYQYFLSCPSRQVVLSIQPESLSFPVQGCLAVSVPSVGPRWSPCAACVALTPARSFHPGVLPSEQLVQRWADTGFPVCRLSCCTDMLSESRACFGGQGAGAPLPAYPGFRV